MKSKMETMYDNSKKSYLDNKTETKLDYYYELTGGTARKNNYREKMRGFLKKTNEYSSQYGEWGALNFEQRNMIRRLLDEMDRADEVIKKLYEENKRLRTILQNNSKINIADHKFASKMEDKYLELQQENKELKERNDLIGKVLDEQLYLQYQDNVLIDFENWLDEKNMTDLDENYTVVRLADIKDKLQELKEGKNETNNNI